jgi:TonB-linked SusC/RagA family outer membrane protein
VVDFPFRYVDVQNKFASGKTGAHVFEEADNESWGPELDAGEEWVQWNSNGQKAPLVSYPNRFKDFFQKGWTYTNNASVNGNYDKGNFRLSLGNMKNTGIVPNTDLSRTSIALNSTYALTSKLSATASINITQSGSDNRPIIDGNRTDPVRSLYEMGAQVDIREMRDYWLPGSEGLAQNKYKDKQNNPYFVVHENLTGFKRDRTVGKIQLDYSINDDLSVLARYTRESLVEVNEAKVGYSNYEQPRGGYSIVDKYRNESNIDFILSYQKTLNDNWSLNAMGGINRLEQNSQYVDNTASQLTLPGLYTISNGAPGAVAYNSFWSRKLLYGVYGSASLGFQDKVFLDLTARNDWSSTLPASNRSYFYPSASLSVILSEMIAMPSWVSMGKIRAGSAQVGNDVSPYSLNQTFAADLDWGSAKRMFMGGTMRNPNLKPEISTSTEVGVDFKFLNNRVGLEATYYTRGNKNQVLPISIPIESGASNKLINAGLVQSRGWEVGLTTTPVSKGDLTWDLNMSFTRNRTYIKKLVDGLEYFNFVSYQGAEIRTYEGGQVGDIYMAPMLTVKDENSSYFGYPLLNNSGQYQTDSDVKNLVKIGNFNNNFMIGFQSTLRYKAFSLYANVDWRQGGSFYSNTMMFLGNNGMTESSLSGMAYDRSRSVEEQIKENPQAYFGKWVGGRNAEYGGLPWPEAQAGNRLQDASFNVGVREVRDAQGNVSYVENLGGSSTRWLDPFNAHRYAVRPFPDRNLYSATYVKLREIAVTYHLPSSLLSRVKLQNASVSIVGNNLYAWTKAGNGVDPERAFRQSGNSWLQGIEYYNVMPWTGSLGFKLNVDF